MPTVTVDPDELRELTGHDEKSDDELRADLFGLGLEFEGHTDDGEFELEFAPDRLDRLSVEGVARSLRYQYGDDRGVYLPTVNDAEWTIHVDGDVPGDRPYVTGAVVRGLDLDEAALESLIQLQEKLHATTGRGRAKGAIGIHDLTMLKGGAATGTEATETEIDDPRVETAPGEGKSIRYTGIAADGDRFVPLDSDRELTPGEVLQEHDVGEKYADLVADYERMPAIYDDVGLFSFPPVINGRRTEVSVDSRDLFVEMTGTDQWTIDHMLTIVCYALDARGGRVEEVTVEYSDDAAGTDAGSTLARPDLSTKTKTVAHADVESTLGIDLDGEEVLDLLERAGLDAETDEDGPLTYEAEIPPYRVDVLHPVDVVDDVGRAFGFNDLNPRYPDVSTVGGRHERSRLERATRETLVGLGFQDLLNFHLVGTDQNFDRLNVDPGTDVVGGDEPAVIKGPYSEEFEIVRTWALPSLMLVLESNTHRAYPQDLAEVGFTAHRDDDEETKVAEPRTVAAALARDGASYEDARARLQALCRAFDADLATPPTDHPTFIPGRTAEVVIDGESAGVIGELHPEVLVEHDLELPVAAFEFELDALR
jgi:phenylalanyl-tRNA synthetase beta chain